MNHTRHDYLQAMDDSLVAQDIDIDVVFCEFVDCANEAATYVGEIFACQKHADLATPLFDIDRISEIFLEFCCGHRVIILRCTDVSGLPTTRSGRGARSLAVRQGFARYLTRPLTLPKSEPF